MWNWARYLAGRTASVFAVILAIASLNFALVRLAPGDPAGVMAGEAGAADAQYIEQLRQEFGLDKPMAQQFLIYVKQIASMNLGFSYRQKQPVATLILDRLPNTLLLTGTAFLFALCFGVAVGTVSAELAGTWIDRAITVVVLIFYATPVFLSGLIAILIFSVFLDWLPAFGSESLGPSLSGWEKAVDVARHLTLPALTLGLFYVATYARLTRAAILEVSTLDFIRTARAKGLPRRRIVSAHLLRNAILPVVTVAGMQAGQLIGGSIVVETVFAWPGLGRLAFDALMQRDYSVLLGIFLVTSVIVIVFNMATEVLYSMIDPRIEVRR